MIATILTSSHAMPQTKDSAMTRNSNAAGAPLPLIPRRANSATRLSNMSHNKIPVPRSNISLNIVPQSPSGEGHPRQIKAGGPDSGFSRAGKGDVVGPSPTRTERRKAERESSPIILEQSMTTNYSTATDTSAGVNHESRRDLHLKFHAPVSSPSLQVYVTTPSLNNTTIIRHPSESLKTYSSSPPDHGDAAQSRLVRKKSGQLVKPSLKSSSSCSKGGLSIVTLSNTSKSEPSTPMLTKVVHFDSQLEHVKLFLAEQKPLAVSRDGSPTDDTSGTDSDFPSFIFGGSNERKTEKVLSMTVNNMPPSIDTSADVGLEDLSIASEGTTLVGRVRLRNMAYTKDLAARFTFDNWLTTSEVIGKYLETIDALFDRFTIMIRLGDILPRIDGKTLIFALRYTVDGREIWDNNHGQNYVATFSHVQVEAGSSRGIDDLRSKLEKVAQSGDRSPCQRNRWQGNRLHADNLKPSASLTSRYESESPLQKPWAQSIKTQTRSDKAELDNVNLFPWPKKSKEVVPFLPIPTLGSPRDLDVETFRPVTHIVSDVDEMPFCVSNRPNRHHQRGYFDVDRGTPGLKRTPSGVPVRNDTTLSTSSVHQDRLPRGLEMFDRSFISPKSENPSSGSDDSTPSIITLSSRSTTPSPCMTDDDTVDMFVGNLVDSGLSHSPTTRYRQLLTR